MISIIIPLYNKVNTIGRTIKSVLSQSYSNYEIIIVDDGSSDGSCEEVKKFDDTRIRLLSQLNSGVSAARNKGIKEAKGEFVAFLDADDEWDKDYLSTQIALINKYPECAVFGTNYRFEDYLGKHYNTIINRLPFGSGSDGVLSNYFEVATFSHVPIWTSSVVIRRNAILKINGFPEGIKSGEDLLTWARLATTNKIAYTKIPHATYHLSEGYEYGAEPVRRQDVGDPVGKELKKLLESNPDIQGLRGYISHWHKMRASVAIRFGERKETIKESMTALKYNLKNIKVLPFIVLAILPALLQKKIIASKSH